MAEKKQTQDYWEIRRGGETLCSSTVPFLGYSTMVLMGMYAAGYACYRNGKRLRKCDLTLE